MVGNTGRGNTHRGDLGGSNTGLLADSMADSGHIGGDFSGGTISARRDAGFTDNLEIFVDNTGGDIGAAQVDTDAIHKHDSPLF